MRRKNEQDANETGNGHIKFRVIEIEVDGANGTLAEGIKALTLAISKGSASSAAARALPTPSQRAPVGTVTDAEPVEEPPESQEEVPSEPGAVARPRRQGSAPTTPDVLSDIDLNGGKVSLKDYISQKTPSGPNEMYATIAVWYKENHGLEEVNANRIYTAYRFLNEIPPNDVAQVLRRLKFEKWFDKGSTKGGYKINIVGLNKVHANFK